MKSGPTATNMVTNSTGPATNVTFSPFNKGTWYWAVTATDLKGQSTTTPVATFVTVNSVCADTGPIAGGIVPPIYTYQSNAINVKIGWTAADLGISCTTPVVPGYSLVIKNPSDAVFLSQNYVKFLSPLSFLLASFCSFVRSSTGLATNSQSRTTLPQWPLRLWESTPGL